MKSVVGLVEKHLSESPKWLLYTLASYGLYRSGRLLLSPLTSFWRYKLRGIGPLAHKYGPDSYVLITGASDGVGKALAYQFAAQGFNLILIARRESLLEAIKLDIEGKFGRKVVVIAYDLAAGAVYERLNREIVEKIRMLDVSILVNNAGVGPSGAPLAELETAALETMLNLNLVAPTYLTHLLLKSLSTRSHRSAVINISSILAQIPAYGTSVYSATKAYLRFFTYAVGEEIKDKVDFLTVNLGGTSTAMTSYNKSLFTVEPEEAAYGILRDVGQYRETDATWRQHISGSLFQPFPLSVRMTMMTVFISMCRPK